MTSTKLLIYNCFIILLCSPDNNGVAGVFLIIWLFFFFFFARYQGLQVIVEKIMTACLPALSLMDCTSQTVSVQPRALSRRLLGCLLKADSICTVSHQWPGTGGVSNEGWAGLRRSFLMTDYG